MPAHSSPPPPAKGLPSDEVMIAFVRTHPNLVFLWHKGRNFRFIAISRLYKFYQGISAAGNGAPLDSFSFLFVSFPWRCDASDHVRREKEGELATTSLEFEYLHRKSRGEMRIGGDDISNDAITLGKHVFQCLFTFPLRADWRKSDSSVDGEPQGNWRWNSTSGDVLVANSPSFSRPAARAPRRACSQSSISRMWNMCEVSWVLISRRNVSQVSSSLYQSKSWSRESVYDSWFQSKLFEGRYSSLIGNCFCHVAFP